MGNASQVLLIDIGTDIWTAIAYAWQPAEEELMERPPRNPRKDGLVNREVLSYSYGYIGILQSVACWFVFLCIMPDMQSLALAKKSPSEYTALEVKANYAGMTSYYWTLVLGQVGAAIATTTTRQSLLQYGLPNKWLNGCIALEILFALLVVYWSPLQSAFKTYFLSFGQVVAGLFGFVLIVVAEELRKSWVRSKKTQTKHIIDREFQQI